MRAVTGSNEDREQRVADRLPTKTAPSVRRRREQASGRPGRLTLSAVVLALLPACGGLWRPFLEPLICDSSGTRCVEGGAERTRFVPENGIDPAWFGEAQGVLSPAQDLVINTDEGTIVTAADKQPISDVVYRQIAPINCGDGWMVGIGVFSFLRIDIPDGIRVRVTGSRALALIAPGAIKIEGLIDARGSQAECSDHRCAGPGGFAGSYVRLVTQRGEGPGGGGPGYGAGGPNNEGGGGGGGGCGHGGRGGDTGDGGPIGTAGSAYLTSSPVRLCGGSGGGSGGPGSQTGDTGQRGGGGGGAVQIVSQSRVVVSSSTTAPSGIQVGGGGGQGDRGLNFNDGGGGGGGGGTLLIEAPRIAIRAGAVLAANGGGGAGGINGGQMCMDGTSALLASQPAAGGAGVRFGGAGGAGSVLAGADAGGSPGDGSAGGGGGVGRIHLNSLSGDLVLEGELSPAAGECNSTGLITPL